MKAIDIAKSSIWNWTRKIQKGGKSTYLFFGVTKWLADGAYGGNSGWSWSHLPWLIESTTEAYKHHNQQIIAFASSYQYVVYPVAQGKPRMRFRLAKCITRRDSLTLLFRIEKRPAMAVQSHELLFGNQTNRLSSYEQLQRGVCESPQVEERNINSTVSWIFQLLIRGGEDWKDIAAPLRRDHCNQKDSWLVAETR